MTDLHPPVYSQGQPSNLPEEGWTFDRVQERLIEALLLWRRAPDREAGWHRVRAYWPDVPFLGFFGEGDGEVSYADEDKRPRQLPLTRDQVGEMQAAAELLLIVPERDRKLVTMVIGRLAAKPDAGVPWLKIWNLLGRGRPGPEGLRKRYSRAITAIAQKLSD